MKIVYVSGESDFSAMDMEDSGELEKLVKEMVSEGLAITESEDGSEVKIIEVGEVDQRFIDFVIDNIADYDLSKQSKFYLLEEFLSDRV